MDKTTKQDPELQAQVDAWRKPFDDYANQVVGRVTDDLDATKCQKGECVFFSVIQFTLYLFIVHFKAHSEISSLMVCSTTVCKWGLKWMGRS